MADCVNKVVVGNDVRLDLTADTVTVATLTKGATAHDSAGARITGVADFAIRGSVNGSSLSFSDAADARPVSLSIYGKTVGGSSVGEGGLVTVTFSNGSNNLNATFVTAMPLRGISVPDGGTCVDENGQEWIADEIILPEGIAVTRIASDGNSVLAEPVITQLSDAETEAFRNLCTFSTGTSVTATDGPFMSLTYFRDTDNGQAVADVRTDLQTQLDRKISVSPLLTLTVAGWSNNQQTVAYEHNTERRNVVDITPTEIQAWANAGVYAISETSSGITFVCNSVPSAALTFKVTSMVIHNEDNIQSEA